MKIAKKEVPDCKDIPLMRFSKEITLKDEEITQLKTDVKKLEQKLQTIEKTHTSPEISEISKKSNVNEVSKFYLGPKEKEIELRANHN
ncbi:hypothetical protein TNIN_251511 [Trichonephila inaurata madagascariensis]|uniref:Uncharacterized protein n=1 Tax=Trichonephila inaurata madagascariensis TaxID=2747483 RepID=A0A8X7CP76_9ARAC|nr:hypothetical protein TNIN_129641 [Trichonephila inaurata madagascariensis]GFY80179.1 hypothetical protein TNIN_251511 [Trichonephila inaurata madagascariensis]